MQNMIVCFCLSIGMLFGGFGRTAMAQPQTMWSRTFGGTGSDYGNGVAQTPDGGFIVASRTNSFGAGLDDIWLIKTDSNGDTLWTKLFGGVGDERPMAVRVCSDHGFIICGITRSMGAGGDDLYLIKTDSMGPEMWSRVYGGAQDDGGYDVIETDDGGFAVTGYTASFSNGLGDL